MDTFRKSLAVFLAILFVIFTVLAILLFNFDRRAFTAETYQRAFARDDFYIKVPNLMAKAIASPDTDKSQLPLIMQGMSVEAWEGFIRALLPTDVLQTMGDGVLDTTFAYLSMQTDSVQVNLTPVKASMVSETGTQAVITLIGTLPACTFEQMAQITFGLFTGDQVQLCNPPAEVMPMLTPVIQSQMQLAAAIIPDQVTLVTAPEQNDPRQRLERIRFLMRLSPLLPLMILLTLTVLIVRSLNDWLKWWGIPFAVTGVVTFIMGILSAPIFSAIFVRILSNRLPTYLPSFLLEFTGDFASAMVRALLSPVMWQGVIFIIVGVGMAGIGYYVKK